MTDCHGCGYPLLPPFVYDKDPAVDPAYGYAIEQAFAMMYRAGYCSQCAIGEMLDCLMMAHREMSGTESAIGTCEHLAQVLDELDPVPAPATPPERQGMFIGDGLFIHESKGRTFFADKHGVEVDPKKQRQKDD